MNNLAIKLGAIIGSITSTYIFSQTISENGNYGNEDNLIESETDSELTDELEYNQYWDNCKTDNNNSKNSSNTVSETVSMNTDFTVSDTVNDDISDTVCNTDSLYGNNCSSNNLDVDGLDVDNCEIIEKRNSKITDSEDSIKYCNEKNVADKTDCHQGKNSKSNLKRGDRFTCSDTGIELQVRAVGGRPRKNQ